MTDDLFAPDPNSAAGQQERPLFSAECDGWRGEDNDDDHGDDDDDDNGDNDDNDDNDDDVEVYKMSRELGFTSWYSVSARDGDNVDTAGDMIVTHILQREVGRDT